MSSFINKAKEKIADTLNKDSSQGDDPRSDNYGSHSSKLANKADPMVDSDLDGRNDPSSRVGGVGNTQQYGDGYGQTGGSGGFATSNTGDYGRDTTTGTGGY
eukprot:c31392_g1_i1 orf=1-303(-)